MKKIRLFECYAGYGGASFGLQKANIPYEIVGYSEIHKGQIKIYEQNHPNTTNYGDITKLDAKDLPDFDLITGGHPCQSFSLAGKRLGLEDIRGNSVFCLLNIIKEKKPKYVLLENVQGILSDDKGRTFEIIMEILSDLGYCVDFKLMRSKDYGNPQTRPRVFYIGIRKDCYKKKKPLYIQKTLQL